jgi:hypothetical protein
MPRHPDFEKIFQQFIARYGAEQGERLYYAWLNKNKYDDTKPFPKKNVAESFQWLEPTLTFYKTMGNGKLYKVHALHVGTSQNMNRYDEEELRLAARSLAERPLNLNHARYSGFRGVNKVVDAEYEDGVVEAVIYVEDPEIQRMIDDGEIKHVSIEAKARSAEWADGFAIQGLVFTGLALLTSDVPPGDPLTAIMKESKVTSVTEPPRDEEGVEEVKKTEIDEKGEAQPPASNTTSAASLSTTSPMEAVTTTSSIPITATVTFTASPQGEGGKEEVKNATVDVTEREWTVAYINDLPDDAFAYIRPGGEKDEQGKTTPRSLRYLPYKNAQGEIDLPHLRNALARLDQTDLSEDERRQALKKLCAAAKEVGLESEKCREELGEACPVSTPPMEKVEVKAEQEAPLADRKLEEVNVGNEVLEKPLREEKEEKGKEKEGEIGKMSSEEIVEGKEAEADVGKGLVPEPAIVEAVDPLAKQRKRIVESLVRGSIREQWEVPISLPTAPTANIAAAVMRSEQISGKPGDTVNVPYVKDFDSEVITAGGSLTEKTSLYATATTTLKEAGAYTQVPYADVEKLTDGILAKIEANAQKSILRAVDKFILDTLFADSGVPEVDHSSATTYFDADYIAEALGTIMSQGKDVGPGDTILVINALQYDALLRDIAASQSLVFARPDVVQDGIVRRFMGVDIVVSKYLPEHDPTNHKYSAYLIHKDAIVYAPKREILFESEKDTVNRKIKMTWTHTFGVAVVDNKAVVEIKTGKPSA